MVQGWRYGRLIGSGRLVCSQGLRENGCGILSLRRRRRKRGVKDKICQSARCICDVEVSEV